MAKILRRDNGHHDRESGLDRRQFLKLIGGAAVAATVVGSAVPAFMKRDTVLAATAGADDIAKNQWAMVIDLRRCDGCSKCTTTCSNMHFLPPGQEWIKVYKVRASTGQIYHLPRPCMQCENPPCLKVCPVRATYQAADGVVLVDQNKCIGCRMCMAACPYEARYFNWNDPPTVPSTIPKPRPEWPVPQQKGTVGKCVFCVHNARVGKLPGCVEGCPMEAIFIGDLNNDLATNGRETLKLSKFIKENDAFRLKEELNTRPRVFYIAGHGQKLEF